MQFYEFSLMIIRARSGNGITETNLVTITGTILVMGRIAIITVGDLSLVLLDGNIVAVVPQ